MTLEQFIKKAREVHGDIYDYSKVGLTDKKVLIICSIHGEFRQTIAVHLYDKCKCPKCGLEKRKSPLKKTTEQFINEATAIHGKGIYDYSLTNYIDSHTDVLIRCIKCDIVFKIKPYAHINKTAPQGCRKCGYENRIIPHQKTTEQYVTEAKAIWPDYDYSMTIYTNKITKIKYGCPKHGIIEQYPNLHLKHGCQFCNGRGPSKYTTETFIKRAVEIHNDKYDYSQVNIDDEKILIICNNCKKSFRQTMACHLNNKQGCHFCNGGVKYTQDIFVEKSNKLHDNHFGYKNTNYEGCRIPVDITCPKHGTFKQMPYLHLQTSICCPACVAENTTSIAEEEIRTFIRENYSGEVIANDREVLCKREIDIYLPELKLGFEYHGMYFHTENIVGRNYHLNKANFADKTDTRLIQIFENEWRDKQDIVKSRILSLLGKNNKIYARDTKVVDITLAQKNIFLNTTHLQGRDNSTVYFGLEHENKLVAVMTFGKARFGGDCDWELMRYSSIGNIVGGGSKLFKHFSNKYSGRIVSFADRRWSNGNLYEKLGFTLVKKTNPGYVYYNLMTKEVFNRMKFQKHKLKRMYGYAETLSEYDIMKLNGFDRIWDCGHLKYEICIEK